MALYRMLHVRSNVPSAHAQAILLPSIMAEALGVAGKFQILAVYSCH